MSTATKKSLLARIASLTDEEARNALNTMAMNLTTFKITVIKDLKDALDYTTPATKKEEDCSKRNMKKEKGAKDLKKRLRAESNDFEVKPLPPPTKKEKETLSLYYKRGIKTPEEIIR